MSEPIQTPETRPNGPASRTPARSDAQALAQHLHDELAQLLSLALMQLDAAQADASVAEPARLRARQLVQQALHVVRDTIADLQPLLTDDLAEALAQRAEQLSRLSGTSIDLSLSLTGPELPPEVAALLLQAASELMFNACKHAPGQPLHLALARHGRGLALVVRDHGPGFDAAQHAPADTSRGLGLPLLRQRLAALGLELQLYTAPGLGVLARVVWEPEEIKP